MRILSARRGLLRFLAPLLVVAVVAGGIALASANRSDSATPSLAPRSAEQLLADVSQAKAPSLSGTVVETARLGLPQLPGLGGGGTASLSGLVSGSHTIRLWLKGDDRSRLALTGQLAESDLIRNRQDLWLYSSERNAVTHYRLGDGAHAAAPAPRPGAPRTPQEAAGMLMAAITPTTQVQVERNARVAGRDAYQLRLRPKAPESLIDSVVLAVDARTSVPLRVQVLAKGKADPAFEVGFTQVQFRAPADGVFEFTPPPGAKVTEGDLPDLGGGDHGAKPTAPGSGKPAAPGSAKPTPGSAKPAAPGPGKAPAPGGAEPASSGAGFAVLGSSWTSVLAVRDLNLEGGSGADAGALRQLLATATPVQGAFGHGRLLRTTLVTVLLTDDGRLYAGAVTPQHLQEVAARPLPGGGR